MNPLIESEERFFAAYERWRKGDTAVGDAAEGIEKNVLSLSPARFRPYRPPAVERSNLRIVI